MREHREILEKLESLDDHTLMKAVDDLQKTSWEDDAPLRKVVSEVFGEDGVSPLAMVLLHVGPYLWTEVARRYKEKVLIHKA